MNQRKIANVTLSIMAVITFLSIATQSPILTKVFIDYPGKAVFHCAFKCLKIVWREKYDQIIETGRQKKIKQIREAQQLLAGQAGE